MIFDKKAILIQARISSSRLPGKMLREINNVPLIEYVYRRCLTSKNADIVSVITSNHESDDVLFDYCNKLKIPVFRGNLENVLKRFIDAGTYYGCGLICRVCGDSPFVDVKYIDMIFEEMIIRDYEYMRINNCIDGFLSETVKLKTLKSIVENILLPDHLEHVTKYILDNKEKYRIKEIDCNLCPKDLEKYSITVDNENDLFFIDRIAKKLKNYYFKSADILKIMRILEKK